MLPSFSQVILTPQKSQRNTFLCKFMNVFFQVRNYISGLKRNEFEPKEALLFSSRSAPQKNKVFFFTFLSKSVKSGEEREERKKTNNNGQASCKNEIMFQWSFIIGMV